MKEITNLEELDNYVNDEDSIYVKRDDYLLYADDTVVDIDDEDIVDIHIYDTYIELQAYSEQPHKDKELCLFVGALSISLQYKTATDLLKSLGYEIYDSVEGDLTMTLLNNGTTRRIGWGRREIWTKKDDFKPFRFADNNRQKEGDSNV